MTIIHFQPFVIAGCALRRLRVQLIYWWRHGTRAKLVSPILFTEHVQRRKLYDRDNRFPHLADKVKVKPHVAATLGARWVVPTLWRGNWLPERAAWPMPFVVKSRHGCGHFVVVRNDHDYERARKSSRRWIRNSYGTWLDEWSYGQIMRGLLVEPFIGDGSALPIDYKFFVFGGRVRYVQVHLDRAGDHRWIVLSPDWKRVSPPTTDPDPRSPVSIGLMIEAAEELGRGFDFVRADFYEVRGNPLFGELTFYPGSGLEAVEPPELNLAMGAWWAKAIEQGGDSVSSARLERERA
ncbi:MAG: ATP-grasp fold amidoligase family protein [Sphingomicrobium sp.]